MSSTVIKGISLLSLVFILKLIKSVFLNFPKEKFRKKNRNQNLTYINIPENKIRILTKIISFPGRIQNQNLLKHSEKYKNQNYINYLPENTKNQNLSLTVTIIMCFFSGNIKSEFTATSLKTQSFTPINSDSCLFPEKTHNYMLS